MPAAGGILSYMRIMNLLGRRGPACKPWQAAVAACLATQFGVALFAMQGAEPLAAEEPPDTAPDLETMLPGAVAPGQYAVATRDPLATAVGERFLADGANAADVAFAIAAAISVSEPHFSHFLGGETWALYYEQESDSVFALDGVGPAGSLVDLEFFRDPELNTDYGPHRVIVPGAWDGWMVWLERFGERELDELMEPALEMAEDGVPVTRSMRGFLLQERDNIRTARHTREVFLDDEGQVPQLGDTLRQEDLARTMRGLRDAYRSGAERDGRSSGLQAARDRFYRGPIAEQLVEFLEQDNGFLTREDFAQFEAEIRDPIKTDYHDLTVYQAPPNSQGISMLIALNILEGFDFSALKPQDPKAIHRIVEATKLGKIDVYHYVGDPDRVFVPVSTLLSPEYADAQRNRIRDDAVLEWPAGGGIEVMRETNTTTYAVRDRYGNAAAVTTSTGAQFFVGGETGILLNQRMANMEITPGNPNLIEPGKKVRHTVNPYMVMRNGQPYFWGGNTGYDTQPQGQIQQFMHIVEFGMSPQEAVAQPRYITHAFPASTIPYEASNELFLERGFPVSVRRELEERGHKLGRSAIIGNANIIMADPETNLLRYGADPRGENTGALGD